jgi:signal transduction histidine kinase
MTRRLKPFSLFNTRLLLAILISLAIILAAFGYITTKVGQKATLVGLIQQGRALNRVLIASASNIIETDRQMTDIAVDRLQSGATALFPDSKNRYRNDDDFLEKLSAQLGLARAAIWDKEKNPKTHLELEQRGFSSDLDSLQMIFLNKTQLDEPFDIIYDIYTIQNKRFLFGVMPLDQDRFVFVVYPWEIGQYSNYRLSLPYLLNQLSREAGIEYILLQNLDGIVFASKQISRMTRIQDDPFLNSALTIDSALARTVAFQDREVLEIVQKFDSGGEFKGLFRIGLSLYGYRELTANFQKQVWLMVAFLLILSLAAFAIIGGYQNLKVAREALNRAQAISQSLHDSIAGIIISTDEHLKIVTANSSARKYFDLPEGIPSGWDYNRHIADDIFKAKTVLSERRPLTFETSISFQGAPIQLLVSSNPIFDDKGKLTGVMIVAQDISERVASEKQMQHSRRLTELGSLAAGLAHDIRNPLNAIGMVIQRLRGEIRVDSGKEEFTEFVDTLDSEQKKLNLLVEKILQVARTASPQTELLDIKPLLEEIIALYNFEAAGRKITINTEIEPGIVHLNKESFHSLIANLIKNAIEAINRDGRIELKSTFEQSGGSSPEKLIITVKDTGPGLSEEQKRNLFRPFYTTKPDGTGLGLATAHKAAVDHGGDLKVESKVGGPTIFIVSIPVRG